MSAILVHERFSFILGVITSSAEQKMRRLKRKCKWNENEEAKMARRIRDAPACAGHDPPSFPQEKKGTDRKFFYAHFSTKAKRHIAF